MKIARHSKIIDLINQYDIETQEELAAKLQEAGFAVTQATVSRDIRELKLMKIAKPDGGSKYTVLEQRTNQDSEKYKRVLPGCTVIHGNSAEYSGYKNSCRNGKCCRSSA